MEAQREVYRALMECNTKREFNYVVSRYKDFILGSEWLRIIMKDTIKRLNTVAAVKSLV
jgi:hypothetical protein